MPRMRTSKKVELKDNVLRKGYVDELGNLLPEDETVHAFLYVNTVPLDEDRELEAELVVNDRLGTFDSSAQALRLILREGIRDILYNVVAALTELHVGVDYATDGLE